MANSKISALTSATTPLAGTETLPVVQSSATTKVTVSNLTAGRAVSASSLTTTGTVNGGGAVKSTGANLANEASAIKISQESTTLSRVSAYGPDASTQGTLQLRVVSSNGTASTIPALFSSTGVVLTGTTTSSDNFVPSTAAKGVNFTANTPASGMTSQLLNWYEEGTWTPNQGSGLTVVGAFSSTGKYTRIGRQITVSGTVTGATSVAVTAAGVITSNLPFTVGTAGHGNATNAALTTAATVICTSTNITSAGAITSTGTITFSAIYFV
jgi:hypothetical protein